MRVETSAWFTLHQFRCVRLVTRPPRLILSATELLRPGSRPYRLSTPVAGDHHGFLTSVSVAGVPDVLLLGGAGVSQVEVEVERLLTPPLLLFPQSLQQLWQPRLTSAPTEEEDQDACWSRWTSQRTA